MSPTSYKAMEVSSGTRAGVAAGFEDYGLTLVVWMSASLVSFKLQSWELKKKSDFLIQD